MSALHEFFESELGYVVVLFLLFVFSRMLQRWRVPSAITCFALGAIGAMGFGLFDGDKTLHLLSTFGIVALFLFAGLEVDLHVLRRRAAILTQHLTVRIGMLAIAAYVGVRVYALDPRPALLIALALLTPSTGFILDSLPTFGLTTDEGEWVKNKAIATELLALGVLFVALQSTSAARLGLASLALIALIAMLPPVFRFFAVFVAPWAPKSEFAFLLMMAIVVSYATRQLGVYYLVGAFLVGVAARRFRESLPSIASERMLHAVEVFASFFAPFYFFVAGSEMRRDDFTVLSVVIGIALTATVIPFRLAAVMVHRRVALGEPTAHSVRVALPMVPTLVFTLVIAGILRDRFALAPEIFGALIVYTILNTVLPGLILRTPAPVFDAPDLPPAASLP
ncbi:MAG TPA: cation:proton antiporter [Gemmatimonadaceae bacterium]|nr:cation:proton antiporter [Gemmatimonadaceae bacterium]